MNKYECSRKVLHCLCPFMQNAHTCLCGNIVSDKFGIPPPSLQEYFQGRPRTDSSLGSTHIKRFMWHMCYNIGNLNNCDLQYWNLIKQLV